MEPIILVSENGGRIMAPRKKNVKIAPAVEISALTTPQVKEAMVQADEVKSTEVKKEEAEVLETTVKKAAAKTAVKKEAVKKTAVKKEDKFAANLIVEYHGEQHKTEDIVEKIKADWVQSGHRIATIKSLNVYIKPEDYTAYYVINEKVHGQVWL